MTEMEDRLWLKTYKSLLTREHNCQKTMVELRKDLKSLRKEIKGLGEELLAGKVYNQR